MTLEDLLAREEIRQVVLNLARGTDRLDHELIRSCYHPDAVDDHNDFRGGPVEFADWVLEVLPHFQATSHVVGPPAIELDGDIAWVETYCVAHHVGNPDESGAASDMVLGLRYVDRFERREGAGWRIAHRVCAFDWSYGVPFDANAGYQFRDDFTVGRRDRSDVSYTRG